MAAPFALAFPTLRTAWEFGVAGLRIEATRADPLVDVHVLRERSVAISNLATIGLGWALFGTYLLLPQFAETDPHTAGYGLAAGAATVGLVLLPLAVGQTAAAGPAASALSGRIPARWIFACGLVLVAVALVLQSRVHRAILPTALLMLVLGVGAGAALETSSAVATQGVADNVAAVSSAVNSTVRRLAGGIGGQVSTMVLASFVVGSSPRHAAFVVCFLVAAVLSLGGAALIAVSGGHGRT